jgi:hypothetical protein
MESCLLITGLAGLFLGIWSVHWARSNYSERRAWWGRRLYIATLLLLAATILLAAILRADGLVPLSLLAGMLLVAMLWETPPALQE